MLKIILPVLISIAAAVTAVAQSPAPHISAISAPDPKPGATITVTGTNFGTEGILWVSNKPAKVNPGSWSDTRIEGVIPDGAISGTVWVVRKDQRAPGNPWEPFSFSWSDGLQSIVLPIPPTRSNGIVIHNVAPYDNNVLQQMLDADKRQLMTLQFINQNGIAANIGNLQGASMEQSGFSAQVGGPPMPSVSAQINSGSTSTSQTAGTTGQTAAATFTSTTTTPSTSGNLTSSELAITGPTDSNSTNTSNQTNVTGPSTQTTYTLTAPTAPTPSASPSTWYNAPSGFAPSASSILNEQVQLNSEAVGLALMMSGSLNDQIYPVTLSDGRTQYIQKHHITLGIPLTLFPSNDHKGEAAEVVLTITPIQDATIDGPPSITAILPEDKTYNTATISNKSVNLGAGVVTQVLTAGVNWLWQKQTYYVVQAQDTVAFQLPRDPQNPNSISFGWDLRPVLGNPTVKGGDRTLFVQLALTPTEAMIANSNGTVTWGTVSVITRWKKVDKKTSTILPDAFEETSVPHTFPITDILSNPQIQGQPTIIDNGDGNLSVRVYSNYYSSSSFVRAGGTVLNASFQPTEIDFTAPALQLATQTVSLDDHFGRSTTLLAYPASDIRLFTKCLALSDLHAVEESSTSAKVTAKLTLDKSNECSRVLRTAQNPNPRVCNIPLTAVLGNKVFGLSNAPFDLTVNPPDSQCSTKDPNKDYEGTLTIHASPDLVRSARALTVERLFYGDPFKDTKPLTLDPVPAIDKGTVVFRNNDYLEIALNGSYLTELQDPPKALGNVGMAFHMQGKNCDQPFAYGDSDTARMLCVPGSLLPSLAQAPLRSKSGDLLLVALPPPDKPKEPNTPTLRPQGNLDAGVAYNLTVNGTNIDKFDHVELEKKAVPAELVGDKQKAILVHLTGDMVKAPKIVLVFFFKGSGNVSYTVKVNKKAS